MNPSRRDLLPALAAMLVFTPAVASAYIDPGMGALVWQAAVAAIAGGVFYFRRSFTKVGNLFRGRRSADAPAQPRDPETR